MVERKSRRNGRSPLQADIEKLPFVQDCGQPNPKTNLKRDFWAPPEPGDYHADVDQGRDYAERALKVALQHDFAALLCWIIMAMIAKGQLSGLEVGFMFRLTEAIREQPSN